MERDVKGKVVVITGGADGLGLAMANSFLRHGAKLTILLDINEENGNKAVATLKDKYGNRAVFYKCNVVSDLDAVYDAVIKNHPNIDVLVNNAGVLDEVNIKRTVAINTTAVMEWTMKFYEHMRIDKGGKGGTIINVSSIYGYRVLSYIPYYHGSKFAVIGFSKSIGHQTNFKKSGVRVLTLCPGLTYTKICENPKLREADEESGFLEVMKQHDWQQPEDIGEGTVDIFRKGDTGSVWLVEGARPAEELSVGVVI